MLKVKGKRAQRCPFGNAVQTVFLKNLIFLYVLDHFDILILKKLLKNKKNIILMHFDTKITLKSNHNRTLEHAR
jgi:hypothetical protein